MKAEEVPILTLIKSGFQFIGMFFYSTDPPFFTHSFSVKHSHSHLSLKVISLLEHYIIFTCVARSSLLP